MRLGSWSIFFQSFFASILAKTQNQYMTLAHCRWRQSAAKVGHALKNPRLFPISSAPDNKHEPEVSLRKIKCLATESFKFWSQ